MKKNYVKKEQKKVKKDDNIVKTEVKKNSDDTVIFNKNLKKIIQIISMIIAYGAAVVALFTFVFGIITVLQVLDSTKLDLFHDNFSISFIANMNGITNSEVIGIISEYGNGAMFVIFNVLIPAIAITCSMIILIITIKNILDFTNKVTHEKDLFTRNRLIDVEKIACLIETIITIHFVVFNRPSVLLFLLICLMFFIIIGLFSICVRDRENK